MVTQFPRQLMCEIPPASGDRTATLDRIRAIVGVELKIGFRNTSLPLLLALAAGCCILLTPSANAGYAVITFGGMKPVMSAGTSLIAAGTVFALLVFPFYVLRLGVGITRDRKGGTGALVASSPLRPAALLAARLLANSILIVLSSLAVLLLIIAAVASRSGSGPDLASFLACCLVAIPAGLCSLPAGSILDRFVGDNAMAKSGATIALWSLMVVCSLMARPDFFGLMFLKQNGPAGAPGRDMAMGIIASPHLRQIPWRGVELTMAFVMQRFGLIAGVAAMSALAAGFSVPGIRRSLSSESRGKAATASTSPAAAPAGLLQFKPRNTGSIRAAAAISGRWLRRSNWTWVLMVASLTASLVLPKRPQAALAMALAVPLLIVNARRIRADRGIQDLERSVASLWRPSPLVFTAIVLAALTAIPTAPVIIGLPLIRSAHVLIGIAASAFWLTWTCGASDRRLLGISVYTLLWYLSSFSNVPAPLDLLGVAGTAVPSLAASAASALLTFLLVLRTDRYGYSSVR